MGVDLLVGHAPELALKCGLGRVVVLWAVGLDQLLELFDFLVAISRLLEGGVERGA